MIDFPWSKPAEDRLTPEHRAHLHTSGLTDETIAQARFASLDKSHTRALGYARGLAGIGIPYPDTEIRVDDAAVPYTRLRVDASGQRSKGQKYENPLAARIEKGLAYYPYMPPEVAVKQKDETAPIFITEGEKKALAMCQAGCLTIGLPGVFMFSDPSSALRPASKPLHPDLAKWRWRGRTVHMCFDSDRVEKDGVALAQERLCHQLTRNHAVVRVVRLPRLDGQEKTGADDFIVAEGVESFRALVANARPWLPLEYHIELLPLASSIDALAPALERLRRDLSRATGDLRPALVAALRRRFPALTEDGAAALLCRVVDRSNLPRILVNERQVREVAEEAWDALLRSPGGQRLFLLGEELVVADDRVAVMKRCEIPLLTALLNRSATWVAQKGDAERHARLPPEVASDMAALPDPRIPVVDGITGVPIVRADGSVWAEQGYDPGSRLYHRADPGVSQAMSGLPAAPSAGDVAEALRFIREEVLYDFPFSGQTDAANAIGAMLLPVVRHVVNGTTPAHVIEAPTEGTGKGLLADVVGIVATGVRCRPTTLPTSEEEVRKKITAALRNALPILCFDNLDGHVDSPSLASALTADVWQDRVLGRTEMLSLPNRAIWLATGNNPTFSRELARRKVRIRLDSGLERPGLRRGFRHPALRVWVRENRGAIVAALITLVRGWISLGRPPGPVRLGSFEEWSSTIGGILGAAGVSGFLDDRFDDAPEMDPLDADWDTLMRAWWDRFGDQQVDGKTVMLLAAEGQLCGVDGRSVNDGRARISFCRQLAKRRDRRFGERTLRVALDRSTKANQYRLATPPPR